MRYKNTKMKIQARSINIANNCGTYYITCCDCECVVMWRLPSLSIVLQSEAARLNGGNVSVGQSHEATFKAGTIG